jgi:hypothetical protein
MLAGVLMLAAAVQAFADVPERKLPGNADPATGEGFGVPNPGTQEQELANITAPAPYNVYEFVVTCGACHSGTVDQSAGHFGNWAGTSMASSARDPIFRANQIIVNNTIQSVIGQDGAGNLCFRCHSPNGWYSGRSNPGFNGKGDGGTMIHSILASTDDEGILCEFCHRSMGNVEYKRSGLVATDTAWNMLAGIGDWPHQGNAYPYPPLTGDPYGDATMQVDDGMTYGGKYAGSVTMHYADLPLEVPDPAQPIGPLNRPVAADPVTPNYTGQTYGIYPPGWNDGDPLHVPGAVVLNPDNSIPLHFEAPIGPPVKSAGPPVVYDYQAQAISLEHPTFKDDFLTSSEFCGTCHDLTVPVLNHGMPEQRTYTEWKYSDFGTDPATNKTRCQDCHMPTMKQEYADDAPVSLNPDPTLAGYFPYGKDRNPDGGTTFHQFAGANRDLPAMMAELYPEVDLEVIGAPTGGDTRVFPGMMSSRDLTWDRAGRNTEIKLKGAATVAAGGTGLGLVDNGNGTWSLKVKVTNNSGHRLPSGYPDGRRMILSARVVDAAGDIHFESGWWDDASATLYAARPNTPFNPSAAPIAATRAQTTTVTSVSHGVMTYEKATNEKTGSTYGPPSPSVLNNTVCFDNRIPPSGWNAAKYEAAGTYFWTYDPMTYAPSKVPARYATGVNYDVVTYTFPAPAGAIADYSARVELTYQSHSREFMEYLRTSDTSTLRPEGPPSIYDPNYPLTPNYLGDVIGVQGMQALNGDPLNDNWGGIAYASWLNSGKGAPYTMAAADTSVGAVPAAVANIQVTQPPDPNGTTDPITGQVIRDPFALRVGWSRTPNADGYIVWTALGKSDATATWFKAAVIQPSTTTFWLNEGLNVGKTYRYKVQAFNAAGVGPLSAAFSNTTPQDLPLTPELLQVVPPVLGNRITLGWNNVADNADGFIIQRQTATIAGPLGPFETIATIPADPVPGGVTWADTTVKAGNTYNYRVAAFNASGASTWSLPVTATTPAVPLPPTGLNAIPVSGVQVDLTWAAADTLQTGFRVERRPAGGAWGTAGTVGAAVFAFSDTTVSPLTTYDYRVFATNAQGDSLPSATAQVTTPNVPPAAPTGLVGTALGASAVKIDWTDASTNEVQFEVYRGDGAGPATWTLIAGVPGSAATTGTYTDTTVQPKSTYSYRVRAVNVMGPSAYSNTVTVVTGSELPQPPTKLRLATRTKTSITVRWTDNSTNEQGFTVQRSRNGVNSWITLAKTGIDVTQYKDTGLRANTTYYFRVRAFNASGTTAWTTTLKVITKK